MTAVNSFPEAFDRADAPRDHATLYTQKDLRREAVRAVRDEAKAAGIRARLVDWALILRGDLPSNPLTLAAVGMRSDTGERFTVTVAL